jgi:glycine/D-amino acid oxidase-like deaminating enzyme
MLKSGDRRFIAEADIVVVGSGSAGSCAAIAAARRGVRVLLLERSGFLGGTSTAVLDTFYGFFTPGSFAHKVVGGIGDDVVSRLTRLDAVLERPNTYGAGMGITYNPEYLKCAWEQLAQEAGVSVLLYCWVQDVNTSGTEVTSLIVATKSGLAEVKPRIVIDASGEADICFWAGSPVEIAGEREAAQSLTTTFKMCNVDVPLRKSIAKDELHRLMRESADEGYSLPRREGSDHITTISGVMATNMTRVRSFERTGAGLINATDPQFLTSAEIEGRRQALEYIRFLKERVPGYKNAALAAFSTQIGIRETRRVVGDYVLTREDVLGARQFDDQIGLCGAPIEDHDTGDSTHWAYLPDGECVGIPYRTLIPQQLSNVFVVGRCFSATHDAHASVRSMAQCMVMGQAAGTAAGWCADKNSDTRSVPIQWLREELARDGAILETVKEGAEP